MYSQLSISESILIIRLLIRVLLPVYLAFTTCRLLAFRCLRRSLYSGIGQMRQTQLEMLQIALDRELIWVASQQLQEQQVLHLETSNRHRTKVNNLQVILRISSTICWGTLWTSSLATSSPECRHNTGILILTTSWTTLTQISLQTIFSKWFVR